MARPIKLEVDIVEQPIEARTEREALHRITDYISHHTDHKFYIGITSGTSAPTALKRRYAKHAAAQQHQLYTMHCLYISASNNMIRRFEQEMIEVYLKHANNVNKINGAKNMKKAAISLQENSYLYLLVP